MCIFAPLLKFLAAAPSIEESEYLISDFLQAYFHFAERAKAKIHYYFSSSGSTDYLVHKLTG